MYQQPKQPVRRWRRRVIGAALCGAGLLGIGLLDCQAEIRNEGARVQVHTDRSNVPHILTQRIALPNPAASYSPDNDHHYPYPETVADVTTDSRRNPSIGESSYGIGTALLPWNQAGFVKYDDLAEKPSASIGSAPGKYVLMITPLSEKLTAQRADRALLIFHLPENALVWVDGKQMPLMGPASFFPTPSLGRGKRYSYNLSISWLESGHWVGQTRKVPVEAGLIQTIYLRQAVK